MNATTADETSLPPTLSIGELLDGYRAGRFEVARVMDHVLDRVAQAAERHIWISRLPRETVRAYVRALESKSPDSLPLYGVPFAIKDNIDLEGVVTTAACPDYGYLPEASAHVVQRLIQAGAIPIGKTNLDQFATGLVGTRSPYGACKNSINPNYVSGGSSSGSAVAVATGLVSFSLGTDTAGSGRVPAAFNNIVGLKPTCGRLSTTGVVPACRSIDCVSIFTLTADDAARVCAVAEGYDRTDAYSRTPAQPACAPTFNGPFKFGIPRAEQLEFFGDTEYARLFFESVKRLEQLGGQSVEIDFAPFRMAARLLYDGAWIAERYDAVGEFIERNPESVHPITRQLILASHSLSAADAFRSFHKLADAKRATEEAWGDIDLLVTPSAGTIYEIADVEFDPIKLNSNLGYYTNFVNFLDFAAVAVPAGFRDDGLPFGITLVGQAWSDAALLRLGDRFHRASVEHAGALGAALPAAANPPITLPPDGRAIGSGATHVARNRIGEGIAVAVCGAHMEGLPLNHQLTSRGATFVSRTRTIPMYRFYALPGGPPFRPGLVRVPSGGSSIDVEVWSVPTEHFGSFVAGIPAPLGIGKVDLEDGQQVSGFLCEAFAVEGARDITSFGGWRQYLRTR